MPRYTLPDLAYDYGSLEPHISGRIMELHHDKHHAGYVKGANTALERLEEARTTEDFTRLGSLEKALAFNLSGHILHSLFWQNLIPRGGGSRRASSNARLCETSAASRSSSGRSSAWPPRSWDPGGPPWSGSPSGRDS